MSLVSVNARKKELGAENCLKPVPFKNDKKFDWAMKLK